MTKTELATKILAYDPKARIDIWWSGGVSNFSIKELQELVAEWKEFTTFKTELEIAQTEFEIAQAPVAAYQERRYPPVDGCIIKEIPEPDPSTPPDFNC